MTDANQTQPNKDAEATDSQGVKRPDQVGTNDAGKEPAAPATGGRGAEGAGGPDGFGTGQ